jgi:hypothetical protein
MTLISFSVDDGARKSRAVEDKLCFYVSAVDKTQMGKPTGQSDMHACRRYTVDVVAAAADIIATVEMM